MGVLQGIENLWGGGCSLAEIGCLAKVRWTHAQTHAGLVCVVSGVRQRLPESAIKLDVVR